MDYKKVGEKFLIGALAGAIASASAVQPHDGQDYFKVLVGALITGAIIGGVNAVKNRAR